jgi:hypothetical protein
VPWGDLGGKAWQMVDALNGDRFERDGDELASDGLYVSLEPWSSHFLTLAAQPVAVMPDVTRPETIAA